MKFIETVKENFNYAGVNTDGIYYIVCYQNRFWFIPEEYTETRNGKKVVVKNVSGLNSYENYTECREGLEFDWIYNNLVKIGYDWENALGISAEYVMNTFRKNS